MIVTEEEAKTKLCQERFGPVQPMPVGISGPAQGPHGYPLAYSHGAGWGMSAITMAPANCIGSGCMAWRWWGVRSIEKDGCAEELAMPIEDMPRELDPKDDEAPVELLNLGYCGKAGKP